LFPEIFSALTHKPKKKRNEIKTLRKKERKKEREREKER
jgi:hypothetical protein